jgi:hypothetical protein
LTHSQELFERLVSHLQYAPLRVLLFTRDEIEYENEDEDGNSEEHRYGSSRSVLRRSAWASLEESLCDEDVGSRFRPTLRTIDLPEYCHSDVANPSPFSQNATAVEDLDLLDSRVVLKFKSTLVHPGITFHFAAAGNQRCDWPANGTPKRICRRLLKHIGVGVQIDYFSMRGTCAAMNWEPHHYQDPFISSELRGMRDLTTMVLHDVDFDWLPESLVTSVNLSSVKTLHIVQCQNLQNPFKLFMRSDTNIEELWIQLLDCEDEDIRHDDPHGFENFIASFHSLETFTAKICGVWTQSDEEMWGAHPGLSVYDADFGNENDLLYYQLDALGESCPEITFFGTQNMVLSALLQDGEWSEAFEEEAPVIVETLATEFRSLTTWKIYHPPVPIGQPLFDDFQPGDDIHRFVVSHLHGLFVEACEEYGIDCKLHTIIFAAKEVVIPDNEFLRYGFPAELTYTFHVGHDGTWVSSMP